jgi:hypothetical protein
MPLSRSEGRNCRITASRARNSDIGSEREKSRIGKRRIAAVLAGFERAAMGDFFRANGLRCSNEAFRLIRTI